MAWGHAPGTWVWFNDFALHAGWRIPVDAEHTCRICHRDREPVVRVHLVDVDRYVLMCRRCIRKDGGPG